MTLLEALIASPYDCAQLETEALIVTINITGTVDEELVYDVKLSHPGFPTHRYSILHGLSNTENYVDAVVVNYADRHDAWWPIGEQGEPIY